MARVAVAAEEEGFHSLLVWDHYLVPNGPDTLDAWNLLSYVAGITSSIRLGTVVTPIPFRPPAQLAKIAATVDVLSNGRLDFGVGKGYRPNEFDGFCIPIEEATERFEESMELLRKSLSSNERFSFHSKRWNFENIVVEPPPAVSLAEVGAPRLSGEARQHGVGLNEAQRSCGRGRRHRMTCAPFDPERPIRLRPTPFEQIRHAEGRGLHVDDKFAPHLGTRIAFAFPV